MQQLLLLIKIYTEISYITLPCESIKFFFILELGHCCQLVVSIQLQKEFAEEIREFPLKKLEK